MADASGVETKVFPTKRRMSRRQFIKGGARRLGGLTVVATAAATGVLDKVITSGEPKARATDHLSLLSITKVEPFEAKAEIAEKPPPTFFDRVFPNLPQPERQQARSIVEEMKTTVLKSNPSYQEMLKVAQKYEGEIRKRAQQIGVPDDLLLGMIFVENGGGEDEINVESGARGIAQLMEETGREYGLRVDPNWREGDFDERANPLRSLDGMAAFLKDHLGKFAGNLGLTLWSYHAGIGNVYKALSLYAQATEGIQIGDLKDETTRVGQYSLHQVLFHPHVKPFADSLKDESSFYPYKVVAAVELFEKERASFS